MQRLSEAHENSVSRDFEVLGHPDGLPRIAHTVKPSGPGLVAGPSEETTYIELSVAFLEATSHDPGVEVKGKRGQPTLADGVDVLAKDQLDLPRSVGEPQDSVLERPPAIRIDFHEGARRSIHAGMNPGQRLDKVSGRLSPVIGPQVAVELTGLDEIDAVCRGPVTLDWRQLEFPATTNGIPRFFRADPDHEGMVKDQQVRRLVKLKKNEKTLTMAAAKAGMSRKTARKYLKSGKLPSQCQPERYWRTRSDPFESVWPEVKEILKRSPTVEAKAVFDHLCRQQEGAFQQGQLRTLQRRIKQWKAEYGEAKEVMFPQKYQPGHQAQSDFTFMGRLGVTIQGQPFPHLLYHFVLAYSNWEATTLCFSESFESLSLGLQNALWELGALPEEHRTDRLSAAVKNLKREEFTERYQALLRHFGMRSSRTQAGKAHENGDVEQSHHRLKRAIEQELLLRCSRDFSSREEYEGFVAVIVSRRNAARQKRLGEELAVMRPLPARRLDDFTRQWVRVSPSSTIRVRHNTYSVDSRLIGERVQVRVWADQVEVYYGGRRQARMPRLRGEGKHRIDYRHVIHSLVRKPGAFTRYRWREDLFPGILFRVAYDELRRDCPATADRQYLKILEVAAQEGEQRVREALQVLIERGQRIRFEALRECLVDPVVEPWEVMVEKMDVGLYDTLLENREVRS